MELSVLFIVFISFLFKTDNRGRRSFIICSMLILFLESALRHRLIGTDLIGYLNSYELYSYYSFDEIIKLYTTPDFKDPTYYVTGWLVSQVFENEQWWVAIISALYIGSITWLIYRESKIPLLSIVMFVSLGYYSFGFAGLRQIIAIAIIVFSFHFLKERKAIPFILMVILASLYHQSALIFLLMYPIANVKLGKYHFVAAIVMLVVFYAFREQLLSFLADTLQSERYQGYTSGEANTLSMTGFIIQVAIFIYNLFYYKKVIRNNKDAIILYNLAFMGVIFQLYSSFIAEMFRISMYFSIFNIILVPLATMEEDNPKTRKMMTFVVLLILLLNTFKNGITPYMFFWQ